MSKIINHVSVLLLVVLVMLFTLGVSASNKKFTVGYSAASLKDALQIQWTEAAKKEIQEAGGKVFVIDSRNKISKQISDIEDLIQQDVDVLMINPVDENGIVPAIKAANKAGIPVITLDRSADKGDIISEVGFDNYKSGFDAGKYIAKKHNKKGKVIQLMGTAGMSVTRERAQGFRDAIAKYPEMEIIAEKYCDWSKSKAMFFVEDTLITNPNIVGIWAHCDDMIMGAIEVLEDKNKLNQVTTVGMGYYGGGPEAIKNGKLDASYKLYPVELGEIAGEVAVKVYKGKDVDEKYGTPIKMITKEDVE